jgi:exodeoxyribonuclease V alpha subunit
MLSQDTEGRDIVYRHEDYLNETNAAKRMIELLLQPVDSRLTLSREQMREEIEGAEKEFGIIFATRQKEAIMSAMKSKVCVITGGPGTGKTTILRAILWIYRRVAERNYTPKEQPQTLLLAPTGKAARRMTESARQKAFTIHKGLGITPASSIPHDPLLTDEVGIVFVDETSMADMRLWARLLDSIPVQTQLVAIGDVDQLPSVSPGAVLRDMIDSGVIPVVKLDVIYRQGEESLIVDNAHKIRVGDTYLSYKNSEFAFFPFTDKEVNPQSDVEVQEKIIELYLRAIKKYGINETLVLCPRREKVTASSYVINERIQALLHGQNQTAQKFSAAGKVLYVDDRIIQTGTGEKAANGDTGFIVSARPDPDQEGGWVADIHFDFMEPGETVEYSGGDFEHIQLGYCLTIHKSQGSEAKAVFIPVLQSQIHVLNRNTLYTGVTRAKEFVGLFGQTKALTLGIRKKHTTLTMFAERLRREYEGESDGAIPCDL